MTVLELLRAVRARLSCPKAWTQEANARDKDGWPTVISDPYACSWCLSGAAHKANESSGAADRLAKLLGFSTALRMVQWNDVFGRTHLGVIVRLDAAIERHAALSAEALPG